MLITRAILYILCHLERISEKMAQTQSPIICAGELWEPLWNKAFQQMPLPVFCFSFRKDKQLNVSHTNHQDHINVTLDNHLIKLTKIRQPSNNRIICRQNNKMSFSF